MGVLSKLVGLTALSHTLSGPLFAHAASSSVDIDPEEIIAPAADPVPFQSGRYIVRFSEEGSAKFRKRDGSLDTDEFFTALADAGTDASPVTQFTSEIFHGASFDLHNASMELVSELETLPEVESIWPAAIFTVPTPQKASLDSEFAAWNPHNDTNVALAHSRGYFGEGVVVAIVDSGIDYNHPALGGGFGAGFKVEAGYDFVGDDYEVGGPYNPDEDPQDCNGHGTHVAGIVASDSEHVPGVAPKARLWAYKVFGCGGSTTEDVIIAAFLRAYEDGADVINASLGSNQGFPDGPLALVATAIQAAGTYVAIAAGNSGEIGPFFTSSGGNAFDTTTVGSVQHHEMVGFSVVATSSSGESREIPYINEAMTQWDVEETLPAYIPDDVWTKNSCSWNDAETVRGAVLIQPRGDCFWQIHDSVLLNKVDFVLFFQYEDGGWELPDRAYYNPEIQPKGFGLILYEDAKWIIEETESNNTVSFEFIKDARPIGLENESYLKSGINEFSSWGPTLDARMKPEISAPGGVIFSTFPLGAGGWSTQSGTSMATPYIAGVAALVFGSQGGRDVMGPNAASLARQKIISSGRPARHYDGSQNAASVAQQGAGLVNAINAIESTTTVEPPVIHLNDTVNFQATHEITITNSGEDEATYQIVHEAGITVHTKPQANAWIGFDPPYSSGEGNVAEVVISTEELTLAAGESQTVSITFTEPSAVDANTLPVYGGAILAVGSQGDVVRSTYMGIKGSLYASDIWEMERGVPLFMSGYGGLIEEGYNYTFEEGGSVPQPYFNILWSTREVSFDFVDRDWTQADWSYPPVPGEKNFLGSFITIPQGLFGTITRFPFRNYPRNSGGVYAPPQNVFAHGEDIPAGEYRILGRVLRTFGDPNNLDDWQWKLSDWFRITREKPPTPSTSIDSSIPSSTSSAPVPTRPCSTDAVAIDLKAVVGSDEPLGLYRYSDFLAIDQSRTQEHLLFELTDDGRVLTPSPEDVTANLYLTVHSNTNSLIYIYASRSVTGGFSYLECEEVDGEIQCASNGKEALYFCGGTDGLLRHGTAPLEGCESVRLVAEPREDPNCASASATSSVEAPEPTPSDIESSVSRRPCVPRTALPQI